MTNLDFGVIWCTIIFIVFRLMLVFASINVTIFRDGDSAWSFWPAAATFRIRVRIRRGREVITFNAWRVTRSWPFTKKKQTKQNLVLLVVINLKREENSFTCQHLGNEPIRLALHYSYVGIWVVGFPSPFGRALPSFRASGSIGTANCFAYCWIHRLRVLKIAI